MAIRSSVRVGHAQAIRKPDVRSESRRAHDLLEEHNLGLLAFNQLSKGLQPFGKLAMPRPIMPEVGAQHGDGIGRLPDGVSRQGPNDDPVSSPPSSAKATQPVPCTPSIFSHAHGVQSQTGAG